MLFGGIGAATVHAEKAYNDQLATLAESITNADEMIDLITGPAEKFEGRVFVVNDWDGGDADNQNVGEELNRNSKIKQDYVWYTCRKTAVKPVGMSRAKEATDVIPSSDWDLADIYYATSKDGFTWEEQGVAVPRPLKPNPGWRSVTTTDILVWKGKYYLYYQAFYLE